MKYSMKCYRCGEIMIYIKNNELESKDIISMFCPNGCEGGYLVPKDNPDLIKVKDEE